MNFRAVKWAYEQDDLNVTAKATLMSFAIHANERGYTWPGVERIASTWGMDRETVRRQIDALLVRRKIYGTKRKVGATGQVKVYRLPKCTYESGRKSTLFEKDRSGAKAEYKRSTSGGKSTPNNEYDEVQNKSHHGGKAVDNSTPTTSGNISHSSGFVCEGHQHHQDESAQNHIKWPEFVAYCKSQTGKRSKDRRHVHDGMPTEDGFWKWLLGQKLYWRDKVKPRDHIDGYLLDGKFYTAEEANRMGRENPDLLTKFRRGIKKGDKPMS